jgi:histone H1/5
MVKEAIIALKDRTGSSPQAIKAWIMTNYPQLTFAQHNLRFALKKGVSDGKLVKTKNSFKLSAAAKVVKKLKVAKVAEKAVAVKKSPAKKAKAATKTKKAVAGKSKKSAVPKAKKSVVAKAAKKVPAKKIGAKPKTVKAKATKST